MYRAIYINNSIAMQFYLSLQFQSDSIPTEIYILRYFYTCIVMQA